MLTKRQQEDKKICSEGNMECWKCSCFTIDKMVKEAHQNAVKHGFWDYYNSLTDRDEETKQAFESQFLMLIVGEVSEAMEGLRKGDKDNFKEELADIVIRTTDLAGGLEIDLEAEIIKKMEKNKDRPYKHGKKF